MEIKYPHYMKLQPSALRARLAARRLPQSVVDEITKTVERQRDEQRALRAKKKAQQALWRELLDPAKREFKTMNTMLRNARFQLRLADEEEKDISLARIEALQAYMLVINDFLTAAEQWSQDIAVTPARKAKRAMKAFPGGIPNGGSHWTDWIPESKKRPVIALFDAIPHKPKAKRKVPFERRIPKVFRTVEGEKLSLFEEFRHRLRVRTEQALVKAKQAAAYPPFDGTEKRKVELLNEALRRIDEAKDGEMLPTTWRGFFPDYEEDLDLADE